MRLPARSLAAAVAVAALVPTGCGTDDDSTDADNGSEATGEDSPQDNHGDNDHGDDDGHDHGDNDDGDDHGDDDTTEVEVEIEDGQVRPSGERMQVTVGEEVRMVFDSDTVDEAHVHADPEHSFDIEPGEDQVFTFTLETPGVFEVELHELGDTIVSLEARP